MIRTYSLLLASAVCCCGCAASGWSPADVFEPPTVVELPGGLGTYSFGGLRDTTIEVTGVDGSNTTTVPSIASLSIRRSASSPINALAAGQAAIEAQRQQTFLAVVAELRAVAGEIRSLAVELRAAAPAQPGARWWQSLLSDPDAVAALRAAIGG